MRCSTHATAAVEHAKAAVADGQAARRAIEKDLAAVQQRQGKYKDQLMEVKTNVEYHAMQHQITAANEEVGKHEEKILVNMMEADELQAALKKADSSAQSGADESPVGARHDREGRQRADGGRRGMRAARAVVLRDMNDRNIVDTFDRIVKVRGTAVARAEGEQLHRV
jgi:predicted  nucleic acid-binding Zn-ribbon protein